MFDRDRYDIVVVGGGPAGAIAAKESAERGASVLLIEERREIGLPIQCTGLLSIRGFEAAGANRDVILGEIRGLHAYGPNGKKITAERSQSHAYVMDRDRFDQDLIEQAREAGVEIRVPASAIGYEPGLIEIQIDQSVSKIPVGIVIGADGANSRIAQWAGLRPPEKFIYAIQVTIPYESGRSDYVEVYLGQDVAPNFFAWAVPSMPGYARVGLGTDQSKGVRELLDKLLDQRFPESKILGFNAGSIPIGPVAKSVSDGVLLVGDAAGQAKPTSGGGIYTGVSCAKIAAEVAMGALSSGNVRAPALASYESRWREKFEAELNFGMLAHDYLSKMSDENLNEIFEAADNPELLALIGEHGDIDYPSHVAKALIKRPALWGKLIHAVPLDMEILMKAVRQLL